MLAYVASISEKLGRIKSIHSFLKIEANSLSLGQVRDVINGHYVLGEQKEIQEVKNAYEAYGKLSEIDPYNMEQLKGLHGIMAKYIVEEPGSRLWHTAILAKWKPIFEYIPIESQIEKFQEQYYDAIAKCHVKGALNIFIEFMLRQIDMILEDIVAQINGDSEAVTEYVRNKSNSRNQRYEKAF